MSFPRNLPETTLNPRGFGENALTTTGLRQMSTWTVNPGLWLVNLPFNVEMADFDETLLSSGSRFQESPKSPLFTLLHNRIWHSFVVLGVKVATCPARYFLLLRISRLNWNTHIWKKRIIINCFYNEILPNITQEATKLKKSRSIKPHQFAAKMESPVIPSDGGAMAHALLGFKSKAVPAPWDKGSL